MTDLGRPSVFESTLIGSLEQQTQPDAIDSEQLLCALTGAVSEKTGSAADVEQAVRLLARMTEWDRHDVLVAVARRVTPRARPFYLWRLGSQFVERGYYWLAASAFVQGALADEADPLTRAALLLKAGAAGNSGSLGGGTDLWLVNGSAMLDALDGGPSPLALTLCRFLAHYTLARYCLFLDTWQPAECRLNQAVTVLDEEAMAALGFDGARATDLPDVLLLRARIGRARLDLEGETDVRSILKLLDRAQASSRAPILLGASLDHHVSFQRAAVSRLRGQFDEAMRQAERACHALTDVSVSEAVEWGATVPYSVNRRRLGYVLCLAGEIERARGELQPAVKLFKAATTVWSTPYYPRGLSRSMRLEASALMDEGRRWAEASRLLSQSIGCARGSGSISAEARAVATKIALHRGLQHEPRVTRYEQRLAEIRETMGSKWPRHRALVAIAGGAITPSKPVDDRTVQLKRIAREMGLIGEDPAFVECLRQADEAAKEGGPTLVTGETGTGKSLLARFIHRRSRLSKGPFCMEALAGVSPEMASSELFGHTKGAFTGALEDTIGVFGAADKGVVFLDDITDGDTKLQGQILQFIESGEFRRVGESSRRKVHLQLVAATNVDLQEALADKRFRRDLLERFVHFIHMPPLRERGRDLQLIGQHLFAAELARLGLSDRVRSLTTDTWDELCRRQWIGNIRALLRLMKRLAGRLATEDISPNVSGLGEVAREFVHRVMESQRDAMLDGEDDEPNGRLDTSPVLHKRIPLTVERFRDLLTARHPASRQELAFAIKSSFPEYHNDAGSILKLIARDEPFARLVARFFKDSN